MITNTKKILPIAFFIICLASFIFATHVLTNNTSIIPEDTNSIVQIVINNTDLTEGANISAVNITIPSGFIFASLSNGSTVGTATFTNTSNVLSWAKDGLVMNITNQTFTFNVTVATAGAYNITISTWNWSDLSSSNLAITVNDTTFPLVSIVTPITQGNYSDSFVINVSITDDTPNKVYFNVTNATGVQNSSSIVASRIGTSTYWNATINTSLFTDGIYNLTVYVNDSNNQLNSTIYKVIRIDNTNPTATNFYCTPTSVYVGETVTCTCTGSADGGSGILSTSFTSSPSTSTAGTSTQTCTITDRAGNVYAPTTTFTVSTRPSGGSAASSSSSSSTTSSWSMTYTSTEEQFQTGYTKTMSSNQRVKVKVDNEDHYVGVKSLTTSSATIEVASNPVTITLDIGEDAKVDVNNDGTYDLYVILNNIVDGKADITIKKIVQEIPEGEESITTTGEITTPETNEPEEEKSSSWIWIVIGILVLVIISAGYKFKPKKK